MSNAAKGMIYNYIEKTVADWIRKYVKAHTGENIAFKCLCDHHLIVVEADPVENIYSYGDIDFDVILLVRSQSELLNPSNKEIALSSELAESDAFLWIVDSEVESIKCISDPYAFKAIKNSEHSEHISLDTVQRVFADDGILACSVEGFEPRSGQLEMAQLVAQAFNDGTNLIVEAGTGIGKSVAYLVPAFLWTRENDGVVVISTNTINLQEQLMKKDIPQLNKAFGTNLKAMLVKGRGNYVCLRRLDSLITEYSSLRMEELPIELDFLVEWAKNSATGDRSDIKFEVEQSTWDEIASEADLCLHGKCQHFGKCHFQRARKDIENARILVVNHHMLCSDLAIKIDKKSAKEKGVLPKYDIVVVDEAHNLPDSAQSHFGLGISSMRNARLLNALYRREGMNSHDKKEVDLGLLVRIRIRVLNHKWSDSERKQRALNLIDLHCIPIIIDVRDAAKGFFESIFDFVTKKSQDRVMRITKEERDDERFKEPDSSFSRLSALYDKLSKHLYDLQLTLQNEDTFTESEEFLVEETELFSCIERLNMLTDAGQFVLKGEKSDYVYWMETGKYKGQALVTATPISSGSYIREWLVNPSKACVMTSATLSIAGNFNFIKNELGLKDCDRSTKEITIDSPYDYKNQVLLGIVDNMIEVNHADYAKTVSSYVKKIVTASKGRAFVLFTSHKLLKQVALDVSNDLEKQGIHLLVQGQMPRHALLSEFKKDTSSTLFGTDSFWEGVDVPGESLSCVVLVRLPFQVPTEPIIQAKAEKIREDGNDPFNDYYVPSAVLRFKQGFGRLVRHSLDIGAVVVLDTRIVTKNYGRAFLMSLPDCEMLVGKVEDVAKGVDSWLR